MSGVPASAPFREKVWQVVVDGLPYGMTVKQAGELFSSFTLTYENEYPRQDVKPEYAEAVRFLMSLPVVRYLIYWLALVFAD